MACSFFKVGQCPQGRNQGSLAHISGFHSTTYIESGKSSQWRIKATLVLVIELVALKKNFSIKGYKKNTRFKVQMLPKSLHWFQIAWQGLCIDWKQKLTRACISLTGEQQLKSSDFFSRLYFSLLVCFWDSERRIFWEYRWCCLFLPLPFHRHLHNGWSTCQGAITIAYFIQ